MTERSDGRTIPLTPVRALASPRTVTSGRLDCLLIGHHEIPFDEQESLVRSVGEHLPGYRDFSLNFVKYGDTKRSHLDLLNMAWKRALNTSEPGPFHLGAVPHLGAAYLTNFLKRRGKRAEWINLFPQDKEELLEKLAESPVCVAITTTLYVFNLPAKRIVEFVREHSPDTPIVVGGPLIGNHARTYQGGALSKMLRDLGADYFIVDSQGEATLNRLVDCLINREDPATVPNLMYFSADGKLQRTLSVPEHNDLDEEYVRWRDLQRPNLGATVLTRTARSCAFKCSFCAYPTRAGELSLASLATTKQELDDLRELGGVQNVVFIDDTFNVPLPRFKDICRLMIREKYGFNWYSFFRCSNADREAVDLMAQAGCKGVLLGIESGAPQILKNMDKFATIDQYARGVTWLKEHDIMTFGSFIVGFPGETNETVQQTIDFINSTSIDLFRSSIWFAEPGTPIMSRTQEYGIEGHTYQWRHNTMDSDEAASQAARVFWSVHSSEWLPKASFGFWMIPYFLGLGMSRDQFLALNARASSMIRLGLKADGNGDVAAKQHREFAGMVDIMTECFGGNDARATQDAAVVAAQP